MGSSIGVSKRDFGTEHWCSACQVYLLRLVVFSLLFSVKILKRLFSVNCVSPTSWQTVAEITLELVRFIKLFKKRMLVAHGASFEQVVYKYFFRKQSLLINVVCVFFFFFGVCAVPDRLLEHGKRKPQPSRSIVHVFWAWLSLVRVHIIQTVHILFAKNICRVNGLNNDNIQ